MGGVAEVVTPEVGRLVELGDLEALAEAALDLLGSPRLPEIRRRAREWALLRFYPERITRAYLEVYAKALG